MRLNKVKLPFSAKRAVLALGSETKNIICFVSGGHAYLIPAHQDLSKHKDYLDFQRDARILLLKKPKIIAFDLHPEYFSSKYALSLPEAKYKLSAVQHHHAHIAACMIENGLSNQKVIGVSFDGTGAGDDNTLWGAEFLVCDYKQYIRKAYLYQAPLLGGEKAISEPWRVAAIWLYLIYKDKFLDFNIKWIRQIRKLRWPVLKQMYYSGFNCPKASSMGRLFDAAASIILGKDKIGFEAELAIELEKVAVSGLPMGAKPYPFKIIKHKDRYIIDPKPIFREIIRDLKNRIPKEKIAYKFHLAVAEIARKTCLILHKETGIERIVLSGGVFQNKLLLNLASGLLYKEGFKVFTHQKLSCSDASIALGQAAVGIYRS